VFVFHHNKHRIIMRSFVKWQIAFERWRFFHCEQFFFKAHISITTCLNFLIFAIYVGNSSFKCSVSFIFIISSPEHEVLSELLWSFNVRRPSSVVRACVRPCDRDCVNNVFKQHLLWNRLLDFDQTSQEWSLGGPLSKLFKPFQLVA